jgi:hypothetical protein
MKKTILTPLCGGLCILLAAAGFAGCVSAAQEKADALFPRHEQARLISSGGIIELTTLDGEERSTTLDVLMGSTPGLTPGTHSLGFYFGTAETTSVPGAATSTTVYSSGNLSITSTSRQDTTAVTYKRLSELLTIENEFKAGRAYTLVSGADGKPLLYEVGYSDWYWQWRVESRKPEEALVTIEDEHYRFAQGPWPFMLLIDGEPSLFFFMGQEYEIALSKGRHTFAVIDKKDPLSETIAASYELDIVSDEAAIEIRGSGKEFTIVDGGVEEAEEDKQAAVQTADNKKAAVKSVAALSAKFPEASGNSVGSGESILEVVIDYTFDPPVEPLEILLDGEPLMHTRVKAASMRFRIPNGPHKIMSRNTNNMVWPETTEEFTANSNLIRATLTQGFISSDDLEIEEKPLR